MRPAVEIVMAAYRGDPYVAAQIRSVLAQTYRGWALQIRDDASDDGTYAIAAGFAAAHPDRIRVERRPTNSGSAQRNFLELITESTGRYVMLADDDDIWLPDKVAVTLQEMRRIEASVGTHVPVLVHTDLTVVDRDLRVVAPSMARAQRLAPGETRLARLLVQNSVTGCTVMVNRALADLVREPFDGVAMHDWWLALLAGAFGRIGFLPVPTVLYRQHGGNTVGAVDARDARYLLNRALDGEQTRARLRACATQARALLAQHGAALTPQQRQVVAACADLGGQRKLRRVRTLIRYGLWKSTALRRAGQVWYA